MCRDALQVSTPNQPLRAGSNARLGLAIRETIGDEVLPAALPMAIEEPSERPDKRREKTGLDFHSIGVAAALPGGLDGNEMVPLGY